MLRTAEPAEIFWETSTKPMVRDKRQRTRPIAAMARTSTSKAHCIGIAVFVLGLMIVDCQNTSADDIDISAKFNRDSIAVESIEPTGNGYRNSGEVFITDGFSGVTPPNGGVNLPDPNGGFGELISAGRNYRFGPYDSSNTTQSNTWIISFDSVDSIDISNQAISCFGVLYSAVGYNPTDGNNGIVTVIYTDLTEQSFVWDVADSNGDGLDSLATIALGNFSPNGMDLFDTNSNTFPGPNNRMWFSQEFTGLDENKVVDSITFSVAGVGDSAGDAEFGIYAISATGAEIDFVPASSFNVFRGFLIGGTLASTQASDDDYMKFNPGFTLSSAEAPVWIEFQGNVGTNGSDFDLVVESNAGTPGLTYTIEMRNFNSASYDVIGVSGESFNSDTTETYTIIPADHVNGAGDVECRIGWRKTGLTINFPWEPRLDLIGWSPK